MNGLLLQAITRVSWNGINLSAYDVGDGQIECLAQNVQVSLEKAESAPLLSFEISPTPTGFEVFQKLKAEALSEPISVCFTYPNSETKATFAFVFAGMSLTTGFDPKLKISAVSAIKGCWTDNKISYTMEDEISLDQFPQFLQKRAGECASKLKFEFVGQAKEKAKTITHKGVQTQRTPHVILNEVLRNQGFDLQISDTALNPPTLVISYSPNLKGELAKDVPEEAKGEPKPAVRNFHIIGPGIMSNLTRDQKFNVGATLGKRNASNTDPVSNTVDEKSVVEPMSVPQESASKQQLQSGVLGENNPGSAETSVVVGDPKAAEKRAALAALMTTKISFTVPMLPKNVVMRPRDIVVIPSLASGGYLEDWEVTTVRYQMSSSTGEVMISISGERPFTGQSTLISGTPVEAQIKQIVAELKTPNDWQEYYWQQPSSSGSSMPLAS